MDLDPRSSKAAFQSELLPELLLRECRTYPAAQALHITTNDSAALGKSALYPAMGTALGRGQARVPAAEEPNSRRKRN